MSRLNNRSARLLVNKWLEDTGRAPLSGDISYLDFATKLRAMVAKKQIQAPFVERADAVNYVRWVARQNRL